jgi:two-component system sensor histidine kinase CpxA
MKSLFAKILLWYWALLAVTVLGSAVITTISMEAGEAQPRFARLVAFQLREARYAYEIGGKAGLAQFFERFDDVFEGKGILTDESGRDLLTGQNHNDLLAAARGPLPHRVERDGHVYVVRAARDGKYHFFFLMPRARPGAWFLLPQNLFVIGAAVVFCYLLAFHLTQPLRSLQKAVERFGQGDFSARAGSRRADELGQLARTFDRMAGRIETLLSAERRLLQDISHELRSPLARLGVAIELARSEDDGASALNRIQKEADRLNSLVGELLEVTRAEGDPQTLRHTPVRLDKLAEELVSDSAIEAQARGCSLVMREAEAVTVEGDPELLRRAAENVIRNAIRYAPLETQVEVSVRRNGTYGVMRVRDYGPGVPEEALTRIFDAFYRVEGDRNRSNGGGVGLGLSIARRAVEVHKGVLTAANAQPGLLVEMKIPAHQQEA